MTDREKSHGFLPIIGGRIVVNGTVHNKLHGEVIRHENRRVIVKLDEFPSDEFCFYNHMLIHEFLMQ